MFLILQDKGWICGGQRVDFDVPPSLLLMKKSNLSSNSALLRCFSACFSTSDLSGVGRALKGDADLGWTHVAQPGWMLGPCRERA